MLTLAANPLPILDGVAPSHCDVTLNFNIPGAPPLKTDEFKAISSGKEISRGVQKKGGIDARFTSGSGKSNGSITLYAHGYFILMDTLSKSPRAFMRGGVICLAQCIFGVEYTMTPPGSPIAFTRRLKACQIKGNAISVSEGDEPAAYEIPLDLKDCVDVINGKEISI